MRFYVEEVEHEGRQVWRIFGPSKEYFGRESYYSQAEAESECKKLNEEYVALEQAVKNNEIIVSLFISHGRVCALIGKAARVHFGRGNYKNVFLPPYVTPKLGDSLIVIDGVITIAESKEPYKGHARKEPYKGHAH
jgi:hypothetical protein